MLFKSYHLWKHEILRNFIQNKTSLIVNKIKLNIFRNLHLSVFVLSTVKKIKPYFFKKFQILSLDFKDLVLLQYCCQIHAYSK